MFKRNIEADLKRWKNKDNRKPLILRGARQTGKTTVIRNFAKEFKNFVEINLEIDVLNKIFSEVRDIKEIIQNLESAANQRIIPGETLLFLDEIQNSVTAIKLLRYFFEEFPALHVIAAGSLLEVRMKKEGWAFPVGRVEFLYLYPVTFNEFLKALNENIVLDQISNCKIGAPISAPTHEKILGLLASYLAVGGMPEAVKIYLADKSLKMVRELHEDLFLSFKEDFFKYSKSSEVEYLNLVWERVPFEIGNRIKYTKLSGMNFISRKISEAFDILHEAMLIERIFPTINTRPPLANKPKAAPKALFLDIGLCTYALNLTKDQILGKLLNPAFEGALFEELVGQELLALNPRNRQTLFFWTREEKGASAELDYIYQSDNQLLPIEVKTGSQGSLKSLHQFLFRSGQKIGIRIYSGPLKSEIHQVSMPHGVQISYQLISVPFYLVYRLPELLPTL